MHDHILRLVLNVLRPEESRADRLFMMRLGWLTPRLRTLTRETPFMWDLWKQHCAALMPRQLADESLHRNDLSLTVRSRCYTANTHGVFVPHGGNGGGRCKNLAHYYTTSLEVKWPRMTDSFNHATYLAWCLAKYRLLMRRKYGKFERLSRKWDKHRALCEQLAERPWVYDSIRTYDDDRCLIGSKATMERQRRSFHEMTASPYYNLLLLERGRKRKRDAADADAEQEVIDGEAGGGGSGDSSDEE